MNMHYFVGTAGKMGVLGNSSGNMSSDCSEGNQVIWSNFQQCIYTPLQWASFAVGLASISVWLGVLMPQIVETCKDTKCVASISAGLLFSWIFGDSTNLVGAFLTKQGLFQVLQGVWFVMTDMIFASQFFYYHCVFKKRLWRKEPKQLVLCIAGLLCMTVGFSGIQDSILPQPAVRSGMAVGSGRHLLSADYTKSNSLGNAFLQTTQELIGYVLGSISAFAYFSSRCFQIYKNVTQRNVKGLSTVTFVMAVLGNFLYGLAIVLYSVEQHYILMHLPWLLGSWGIMAMDCFIVFQIKTYSRDMEELTIIVEETDQDESRPLIGSINSDLDNTVYGAVHPERAVF